MIRYVQLYIEVSPLYFRLTIQGQSDHSHLELAGGWTSTHAKGEVVEWK